MRGSCHCGSVIYEVTPPLRDVVVCHCSQCRKTSGHVWAASSVMVQNFRLTEDRGLQWFDSSDVARRGFCRDCGASLFWQPKPGADPSWTPDGPTMHFSPGSLDGPTGLKIIAHIHKEDRGDYYEPEGPPCEAQPADDLHGACLCGANRFSLAGPMGEVGACHCGQCRKLSGHYSASFWADEASITWEARETREYATKGGGRRGFCPVCGASLWFRAKGGDFSMEAGAFDRPTGGRLTSHIFMAEAGDYYTPDDNLPQWQTWEKEA